MQLATEQALGKYYRPLVNADNTPRRSASVGSEYTVQLRH